MAKNIPGVSFTNKFLKRCYRQIFLYHCAMLRYSRASHIFSADFFSNGQEVEERCSSVVELLYGGGMYDEKFSRGSLRPGESHVFFSLV
jgi:hypothetical protein